jgi:lipopolysaccharide transport system permease protein
MLEDILRPWRHWDLVVSFALRDIKARYKQSVLGIAWALLQPLSMMVVFTLVFSVFAKVPSDGLPYPIFSYSALIFWTFFSNSISTGTMSMVANATLIRKIYFPRETLLTSVVLAGCLDLGIALVLFVGMAAYYHITFTAAVVWVVPLVALQILLGLGVTALTAAAHVNFRDIGHALPLLLQLWMFATPVGYPMSVIPAWLRPFYMLNPMAGIVDGYRRAILLGSAPDLSAVAVSAVVTMLILAVAVPVFKRAEKTFADVI